MELRRIVLRCRRLLADNDNDDGDDDDDDAPTNSIHNLHDYLPPFSH